MTDHKWKPGDVYFAAEHDGERDLDLGDLAADCREKWEAEENAREWLAGFTSREQETAVAYVTEWEVTSVDDEWEISTSRELGSALILPAKMEEMAANLGMSNEDFLKHGPD